MARPVSQPTSWRSVSPSLWRHTFRFVAQALRPRYQIHHQHHDPVGPYGCFFMEELVDGRLLFAESHRGIRVCSAGGAFLEQWTGTGNERLAFCMGLAVHGSEVAIADFGTARIQVWSDTGQFVRTLIRIHYPKALQLVAGTDTKLLVSTVGSSNVLVIRWQDGIRLNFISPSPCFDNYHWMNMLANGDVVYVNVVGNMEIHTADGPIWYSGDLLMHEPMRGKPKLVLWRNLGAGFFTGAKWSHNRFGPNQLTVVRTSDHEELDMWEMQNLVTVAVSRDHLFLVEGTQENDRYLIHVV